jgi:hypothetical protein
MLILATSTLLLLAQNSFSQASGQGILKGLKKASINVYLRQDLPSGIDSNFLKTVMSNGLHEEIPELQITEGASSAMYLEIQVVPLKSLLGGYTGEETVEVQLNVYRPVFVINEDGGPPVFGTASVWEMHTVFTLPNQEVNDQLRRGLDHMIAQLSSDYYRQNRWSGK